MTQIVGVLSKKKKNKAWLIMEYRVVIVLSICDNWPLEPGQKKGRGRYPSIDGLTRS